MILSLLQVHIAIQVLFIVWIIISVADIILTNIYCSKPLFQFYLLFPTGFPCLLVYFIIAFISILINHSYVVIDYRGIMFHGYSYTPCDAIKEHYDCNRFRFLISAFITLIATICFALSPLLSVPIAVYIFAKRAKTRMEVIPSYGSDVYGTMRDVNYMLMDKFISHLPKTNLLWHDPTYLRCMYFTMKHIPAIPEHDSDTRKFYLKALMDILSIHESCASDNGIVTRSMRRNIDSIWYQYFCNAPFCEDYYNRAPWSGYHAYVRGYICLLVYILCVEVGLFWVFITRTNNEFKDSDELIRIWWMRDIIHLVLFVLIIWMYYERIKSEIRYRYCWKHPSASFNSTISWHLMYEVMWLRIVANKMSDCFKDSTDIFINDDIEWMTKLVLEYCVTYNLSTKYDTNNVEWFYNAIYGGDGMMVVQNSNLSTNYNLSHVLSLLKTIS